MLRKIHFYKRLLCSADVFIDNMFCTFLYNNCDDGILFKYVFIVNLMPFLVSGQPFRTMFYVSIFVILLYFYLLHVYSLFLSVSLPDLANKVVHYAKKTFIVVLMLFLVELVGYPLKKSYCS